MYNELALCDVVQEMANELAHEYNSTTHIAIYRIIVGQQCYGIPPRRMTLYQHCKFKDEPVSTLDYLHFTETR